MSLTTTDLAVSVFSADPVQRQRVFANLKAAQRRMMFQEIEAGTECGRLLKQELLDNLVFACKQERGNDTGTAWSSLVMRSQQRACFRSACGAVKEAGSVPAIVH